MRRLILTLALVAFACSAHAADKLTLQLKWVPQAQFAGYYVALAKGFYKDAGLDVTIRPGGPDISPEQVLAGGGADVIVDWMPGALAAREKGVKLVNIAQIFARSGMMLTCRKDSGVTTPQDLKGKTLGVWFSGNEFPFLAWMQRLGYKVSGSDADVRVLKQGFNVDPLLQKQAACISTMTYNEYGQVLDAGLKPDQLAVFGYEEQGVAMLEDGLYALESKIADATTRDRLARFVKATLQGWDYALAHQDEAVKIVLDNDASGAQTEPHQKRMLAEVAKLAAAPKEGFGYLRDEDANRTVEILLGGKSDPVITKKPDGAWTHDVWKQATAK
jgi:NitT/TauT family transport system substrate-binding protein